MIADWWALAVAPITQGGFSLGYVADALPPSATLSPSFDVTVPGSGNEFSPFRPRVKRKDVAKL